MAHINLLPWRDAQRQKQKQQYLGMLAAVAAISGLIFWFIGEAIDQQISNQNARNRYLEQEIALLDAQIRQIQKIKESKNAIEQRMALIEQLQASRNTSPAIFDELARIVPPGVSFKTMRRNGNNIEIQGVSESNNRLSEFMRRIENSDIFNNGELSSIVADTTSTDSVSDFILTFTISPQLAPDSVVENTTGGLQ